MSHVITESGAIRTKYVVIAGGAWSSLFCGNFGLYFPQLATINSSMQRVQVASGPPGCGQGMDCSWRRQANGEYSVLGSKFFALITRDSLRMVGDFLPTFRHTDLPIQLRLGTEFFESMRVPHHWKPDEISPFERARVLTADYDRGALDTALQRLSTDFGITEQQWRIVRVLLEVPALEPHQIGELCAISSPSMAGVLERMDQAGYITRRRVEHDQRRVLVSLTAKSRDLAASMAPEIDSTYRQIEAKLGAQFSVQLHQALDVVLEQLPALDIEQEVSTRRVKCN